jgi:hypothetical protein
MPWIVPIGYHLFEFSVRKGYPAIGQIGSREPRPFKEMVRLRLPATSAVLNDHISSDKTECLLDRDCKLLRPVQIGWLLGP